MNCTQARCKLFHQLAASLKVSSCSKSDVHRLDEVNRLDTTCWQIASGRENPQLASSLWRFWLCTTLHTIKKEPIRSQHREPYSFAPQHSRNVQLIAFYASSPVAHARESPIVDFAKCLIRSLEVNGNKGTNADVTKIAD